MNREVATLLESAWSKRGEERYDEAHSLLMQARSLCADDDYHALGRIFHIYMQLDYDQGLLPEALELCLKSLVYYQKAGISDRIAHATRHLADLQRRLGQLDESESNYRKAIRIYKDSPTPPAGDFANALRGFAMVLERLNKPQAAIAAWREAKARYQSLGVQAGVDEASAKIANLRS